MKAIFGVLSLLIVLAIVGTVARKPLQAAHGGVVASRLEAASQAGAAGGDPAGSRGAGHAIPGGAPGGAAGDTAGLTVPQQSRNLQEQVRNDTARMLQQGVQRNESADR